jgi:hypothetical protein
MKTYTKYSEYKPSHPILGVYKDMESHPIDIPPLGWRDLDHLYIIDGTIKRFPGWAPLGAMESAYPIIYGYDFKKFDNSRHFVFASKSDIYYYNRSTGAITSIASGFSGTDSDRWQSSVLNDKLYLTNGEDAIQEYQGDAVIAALVGDESLPRAKYIITSAGHLVCGYTTEGTGDDETSYPRRVRWSDVGDPNTWVPNSDTNEAGVIDLPDDIGELKGIGNLGTNSFVAYGSSAIYLLSYIGLPAVWQVQRVVIREGLYMPYSLIVFNDKHFFIDQNDFKMFDGGSNTKRLGIDRVSTWFFEDFNSSDYSNVYGFAHPILPIVGWVYVPRTKSTYDDAKAILYNYANDTWTTRSEFPHWMMAAYRATTQQPDAEELIGGTLFDTITVTNNFTAGVVGTAYSKVASASGGTSPYTYSVASGTLPTGLTLAPNGTLAGTPSAAAVFTFVIRATDVNGVTGISGTLSITVAELPARLRIKSYDWSTTFGGHSFPVMASPGFHWDGTFPEHTVGTTDWGQVEFWSDDYWISGEVVPGSGQASLLVYAEIDLYQGAYRMRVQATPDGGGSAPLWYGTCATPTGIYTKTQGSAPAASVEVESY